MNKQILKNCLYIYNNSIYLFEVEKLNTKKGDVAQVGHILLF